MLKKYYISKNARSNGDHEIHAELCMFLPQVDNRQFLGKFISCTDAMVEAKKHYFSANACKRCSENCRTQ